MTHFKNFFSLISVICLSYQVSVAQVTDRTETDCSAESESIDSILNQGNVLVIAMMGLDCPGCNLNAPKADEFATEHANDKIRLWVAANYIAGGATCSDVIDWASQIGFEEAFVFLDSSKYWENTYRAEWLVIDPADRRMVYKGFDMASAVAAAKEAAGITSTEELLRARTRIEFRLNNELVINASPEVGMLRITLVDLNGRMVQQLKSSGSSVIRLDNLQAGIYIVRIQSARAAFAEKIVLVK